jgi:hypothetical protein
MPDVIVQIDMPTYKGPVNTNRRDCLLKYGRTLPPQAAIYTLQCSEDVIGADAGENYFNLDLSKIYIRANNRAEAVVIWLDYQNKNLDCRAPHDGYEMMDNIPDYDEEMDNDVLAKKYVQHMFENEFLQMHERTLCLMAAHE